MPLGADVGHGSGDIFRWRSSSPTRKGAEQPTLFDPCVLWPNGWMDQDRLGTEVGLSPGDIVLDGDLAAPTERGTAAPIFGPCLLWPKVAHLSIC